MNITVSSSASNNTNFDRQLIFYLDHYVDFIGDIFFLPSDFEYFTNPFIFDTPE